MEERSVRTEDKIIGTSAAGFILGSMLMASYRSNAAVINQASTYGLAARAIGLGSILSLSTVGLLIGGTAKALDIHNMTDLRRLIREFMQGADHAEYELVLQPVIKK